MQTTVLRSNDNAYTLVQDRVQYLHYIFSVVKYLCLDKLMTFANLL